MKMTMTKKMRRRNLWKNDCRQSKKSPRPCRTQLDIWRRLARLSKSNLHLDVKNYVFIWQQNRLHTFWILFLIINNYAIFTQINILILFILSTFNFSVPELSWLTALLLLIGVVVLKIIPIRMLLLLWGIIKFSKKIIKPHTVNNNEVLDLLSRVPDDEEIVSFIFIF